MQKHSGWRVPAGKGGISGLPKLHLLLFLGLIGLLAACSSGTGQLPTGDVSEVSTDIFFSAAEAAELSAAAPTRLNDQTVSGQIEVFVQDHPLIEQVQFFLDDADRQGQPWRLIKGAPYGEALNTGEALANGEHSLTAAISVKGASSPLIGTATFTVENEPAASGDKGQPASGDTDGLPAPWRHGDVGEVGQAGSASFSAQGFTISMEGAGADIWNRVDGFHFVYQGLSGDGAIIARVNSLTAAHEWAKAGLMIRDGLAADASHAMVHLTTANGVKLTWRNGAGNESDSSTAVEAAAPQWLKLVRAGDTFSGYLSADGKSWTHVASQTISMDDEVYVGLALTSHDASQLASAEFAQVLVTTGPDEGSQEPQPEPEPTPTPEPSPSPEPTPAPDAADYYVATDGSDSNSGRSAAEAFRTIQQAADVVEPGDTVYIRGGVYPIEVRFTRSGTEDAPITFMSYPGEWAILEGPNDPDSPTHDSGARVWVDGASWNVFKNFEVRYSPQEGIYIFGDASHNVFENIVSHHNYYSGFQTSGSASHNQFIGVTSHSNHDFESGGQHGDGINMQGGGQNLIINSRVYNNSDDGMDFWASKGNTVIGNLSYDNGYDTEGNGNGFKMGGAGGGGGHTYIGNVAFNNKANGFDHNASPIASTLYNNTAYNNGGYNFDLGSDLPHVAKNNLSVQGEIWVKGEVVSSHNSWDLGISDPLFISTDPSSASFLSLAANSPAVDAGVDVGRDYLGDAPDLGAVEQGQSLAAMQ